MTRQQLLAQMLQGQPNVTTGAASPSLRTPVSRAAPTAESGARNRQMAEILSQDVPTPKTQRGSVAPVDASMLTALGNIGTKVWGARKQGKADDQSRELLARELAMAKGEDPFASELQPVAPPVLSGRAQIMEGPGAEEASQAARAGVSPFVEATRETRKAEAPGRAQHDLAALTDPTASSLAGQRIARDTTPQEWSDPYVDENTGALVQRHATTGQLQEISRPPSIGGANSRYASPQITETGRIVMMDKAGGPAIYADSGEQWDGQTDPVSADMQLITLPDGSVQAVNMRRDVGRAPARAEEVVDPKTAVGGAATRAGAETAAKEAAETEAIPERTRVEAQAEDFEQAPARLEASRGIISGVEDLEPVFDDVLANANLWTTGFLGQVGQYVGGSPQANLAANLNTLQANSAFDRLQEMRNASQTGGALGQVSERELDLLRDAMAALAQSQSPEQFKRNVQRLKDRYQSTKQLAEQASRMDAIKSRIGALQNRPQSESSQAQIDSLYERLYREEDKLWSRLDDGANPGDGQTGDSVSEAELPNGITEADIQFTMEQHGLSREAVLERLQ